MFEESVSIPSIWASMNSWFTPTVLFLLLNLMIATIAFTSTLTNNQNQNKNQKKNQVQEDSNQHPTIVRSPSVLQRLRSFNLYAYRSQDPIPSPPLVSNSSSTHFVQSPDSYTLFSHHQHNHFDFHQTHDSQILETQTHFDFHQTHEPQILETQTHFDFQKTHGTHFDFQKTHETHFDFQKTHESQIVETQTDFDFHQTHESHFDFHKTRESQILETQTQFEKETGEENPQSMDEIYRLVTSKSDTQPEIPAKLPAKIPTKMKKSASSKTAFAERETVEARRPATVREKKAKVTEVVDDEVDAKADDFINKFKQQLKLQRLDSIVRYKRGGGGGGGGK